MSKNSFEIDRSLIEELTSLIEQSKQQIAISLNASMSYVYWQIGRRINSEILNYKRAAYGKQVLQTVSTQLELVYGSSFSEKNIRRMMQFAEVFPDQENVVSLIRQLSWTHLLVIIPITDPLKREFYIEMCKMEKWSVRTFRERVQSMLYERTAISKKPEETIKNDLAKLRNEQQIQPDMVFRDPYLLDFWG